MAGSEAPKITTAGTPKAAAMWAGTGIVADEERGAGDQRLDFGERRAGDGAERAEGRKVIGGAADEDRLEARLLQVFRDRQEAAGGPGLPGVVANG